jgi:hypothetical protein
MGTQFKLYTERNLFNRGCRPITALCRFMRVEFSIQHIEYLCTKIFVFFVMQTLQTVLSDALCS